MQKAQAREIVGALVAAFRPRDFGAASEAIYVEFLEPFDHEEAVKAARWIISHDTYFPTVARLTSEIADDYHAPPIETLDRAALPGATKALPAGDVVVLAERIGELREKLRTDPHVDYDPAEVEKRKAEAREAAEKARQEGAG